MLNKKLLCLGAIAITAALSAGCNRSPEAKEAEYLKSGRALLAKNDTGRALLEFMNAAKIMPKDAEPYYQLGLTYLALHNPGTALGALKKATELNPKRADAQLQMAKLMATTQSQNLLQDAMNRLQSILAASPDNLEAIDTMAIAEWKLGKTDGAEKLLEGALAKSPADLKSAVMLSRMMLNQKDPDGAEKVLKKAAATAPKSAAPALALGSLYAKLNQADKAEAAFRNALQLDPKSAVALLGIATVQLARRQLDQAEQTLRQVAALPDQRYDALYAVFLYQSGKRDAALAEFERIAKEHPDDRTARTRLLEAYFAMNKQPEAQGVLAAALKKNPKDADALFQRSKLYLRTGKAREAQQDLNQITRFLPNDAGVHMALAATYKAQGQPRRERQELNDALGLDKTLLAARFAQVDNFVAGSDLEGALRLLEDAPVPQKKTLPWIIKRNRVLLALHKTKELRVALDQVLPDNKLPELMLQDAILKLAERDFARAREAAEEVLKQNPEEQRAARVVVDSYIVQKQPDKADERLKEIVVAHPNSAPLQNLMGEWHLSRGNLAGARRAWEAAKSTNPKFWQADVALADLDRREQHPDQARQRLVPVVAADPGNVTALMELARIAQESGNRGEAIARYRAVLGVDGSNLAALNNLAYHLALDNPDEGLKIAQQAAELAPDNAAVQDTLGFAFYRKGLYNSAVEYVKAAFAKEPTARRQFHLGMSYLKVGQKDLGQQMLVTALQKDPNLVKTEQGW
jgi:tetratricopeptide (TPR) repeat protein